ncbi:MAG: antibiotic biosynthesis monooxygenase [Halioglobus sp.]
MIVVNGVLESTEADIEAMKSAISAMENASREESGCFDYTFSVEISNTKIIRITECWESIEALQAHFITPHMAVFQEAIAAHPPVSMDVKFFEAEVMPSPLG